jgi:tetratricopeptide (TPR) repeat protein
MYLKPAQIILSTLLVSFIFFSTSFAQTEAEINEAMVKGLKLVDEGRLAEAVPYLDILVKATPDEPKLRFIYGAALLTKSKQIDNNEEAKKLSAEALEQFKAAKKMGMNDPRIDVFIQLLSGEGIPENSTHFSKNPEADKFMQQAETSFSQSKYDEALGFYQKALALDPNIYEAALYSGDVYAKNQDWENAEKSYQKAIAINPDRETAYRYSATPLMKQKKYDQARDRYIEALITEPYSQMSPRGISQWAEITGAKLGHPKVEIPEIKFDANGQVTMAAPADNPNYNSEWKTYIVTRISWRKEKFAKVFPNEKKYRHTLQEETEAIRSVLKSAKEQNLSQPHFTILAKLEQEGLLEAFILMAQADEGIAEDHEAYLKNNRVKLRQYVLNYVIQK